MPRETEPTPPPTVSARADHLDPLAEQTIAAWRAAQLAEIKRLYPGAFAEALRVFSHLLTYSKNPQTPPPETSLSEGVRVVLWPVATGIAHRNTLAYLHSNPEDLLLTKDELSRFIRQAAEMEVLCGEPGRETITFASELGILSKTTAEQLLESCPEPPPIPEVMSLM